MSARCFGRTTPKRCRGPSIFVSYEDVKENAEAIYERLAEGSMPCDEPWPDEHVQVFRDWIDGGMPP